MRWEISLMKGIPSRGNSKCGGSEAGMSVVCARDSKEASMAAAERATEGAVLCDPEQTGKDQTTKAR